jgi:predicted secreted hydrolase
MAHFTLTDEARQRFFATQRLSRQALEIAGVRVEPFELRVKDWYVTGDVATDLPSFKLRAREGTHALELELRALKGVVLNGGRGLDQKGPELGNASFYYSLPRLAATGTVQIDGRVLDVTGTAWMDREWSTSGLSAGIVGWDWFSLHLSDGRDLMFYRLREADGQSSRYSKGSLIAADGSIEPLGIDDVQISPRGIWRSESTGIEYPVSWRLRIVKAGIDLALAPYVGNQEVDLAVRYWEGAVRSPSGTGLSAEGYLELAGYGDPTSAER